MLYKRIGMENYKKINNNVINYKLSKNTFYANINY